MSISGVFKKVSRVVKDVFNPGDFVKSLTEADDLGTPPSAEDPNTTMAKAAKNSAIAGDIAVRNAQQRSSTLGAGSRFIEQQMKKEPLVTAAAPTGPVNTRGFGTNPLAPAAATDILSRKPKRTRDAHGRIR